MRIPFLTPKIEPTLKPQLENDVQWEIEGSILPDGTSVGIESSYEDTHWWEFTD